LREKKHYYYDYFGCRILKQGRKKHKKKIKRLNSRKDQFKKIIMQKIEKKKKRRRIKKEEGKLTLLKALKTII